MPGSWFRVQELFDIVDLSQTNPLVRPAVIKTPEALREDCALGESEDVSPIYFIRELRLDKGRLAPFQHLGRIVLRE